MDPRPSTSSSAEDKDKEKDKEPHFLSLVGPGKIKRGSLRAKKTADPKPALNLNLNLVNTSPLATPSSAAGFSAVGSLDLSVNSQQMATAVQSFGSGQSNANTRKKQPKELVSAQVSKRISSASKDYQLLWNVVLQRLSISPSLSKELRAGGNVSRVEEKLMAGDSELSGYLALLGEQDKFHVSSPIELLNLLIKTFHTARRMLTEKKPTTLAVVKIMRELDETLQRLPKLSLDAHVAEILGWWAPQIVEAITIVQLYLQQHPHSGSSSSSSSTMPQPSPISHVKHSSVWPEVKNIHQFVSTLACSTALSLVLLRGHYLPQDSFLLARISCPGANVNLESSEAVLWSNVDQKSKQLTDLIRGGMCLAQQQLQQSSDSLQSSSDRPSLSRHSSANGLGHQSSKHSSIFSQSNSGSAHSSSSSSSSITRAPFGVKPSPFRTDSLKFLSPEPSAPKSNGTNSWKDVYNNLPVMYAEAVLLIVSQLSFDTRVFLNMDVESRSGGIPHLLRSTSSSIRLNQSEFAESFVMTTEHDHAMKVLLDRISNLLQLLEQLRLHWPNDSCESINRLMFIMSHEVQRIHRLDDMCVPFLVPEVWDAWYMFVQVMMDFLGFIALLVKREAAYDDVQSRIGQVIVQVRFMEKIQHLQSSETSLFSRDLTLFV